MNPRGFQNGKLDSLVLGRVSSCSSCYYSGTSQNQLLIIFPTYVRQYALVFRTRLVRKDSEAVYVVIRRTSWILPCLHPSCLSNVRPFLIRTTTTNLQHPHPTHLPHVIHEDARLPNPPEFEAPFRVPCGVPAPFRRPPFNRIRITWCWTMSLHYATMNDLCI
jgi:hypothetical protein